MLNKQRFNQSSLFLYEISMFAVLYLYIYTYNLHYTDVFHIIKLVIKKNIL